MSNVRNYAAGALAGAAGGIAGTVAMDLFSAAWTLARRGHWHPTESTLVQHGPRSEVDEPKRQGRHSGESEAVATVTVAEKVAAKVLHRRLSPREKDKGGRLVHYTFGAVTGAAYGAGVERYSQVGAGAGVPFGLAIWAVGVEAALPVLHLSDRPDVTRLRSTPSRSLVMRSMAAFWKS